MPNYSGVWSLSQQFQAVGQGLWPPNFVPTETFAIFALGGTPSASTTRDKYTYSGDVVSAGSAATVASYYGSAAGNSTVGIFALGCNGAIKLTCRNKYTYSGDAVSAGGAATAGSRFGAAAGNSTVGIFALQQTCAGRVTTRNK